MPHHIIRRFDIADIPAAIRIVARPDHGWSVVYAGTPSTAPGPVCMVLHIVDGEDPLADPLERAIRGDESGARDLVFAAEESWVRAHPPF